MARGATCRMPRPRPPRRRQGPGLDRRRRRTGQRRQCRYPGRAPCGRPSSPQSNNAMRLAGRKPRPIRTVGIVAPAYRPPCRRHHHQRGRKTLRGKAGGRRIGQALGLDLANARDVREACRSLGARFATDLSDTWGTVDGDASGPIDVMDLFSGCGGMSTGFLAAGAGVRLPACWRRRQRPNRQRDVRSKSSPPARRRLRPRARLARLGRPAQSGSTQAEWEPPGAHRLRPVSGVLIASQCSREV